MFSSFWSFFGYQDPQQESVKEPVQEPTLDQGIHQVKDQDTDYVIDGLREEDMNQELEQNQEQIQEQNQDLDTSFDANIKKLHMFVTNKNRYPNKFNKNKKEKKLYRFQQQCINKYKSHKLSDQQIQKCISIPEWSFDLFEKMCDKITCFIKENNRLPCIESSNKNEQLLAKWYRKQLGHLDQLSEEYHDLFKKIQSS